MKKNIIFFSAFSLLLLTSCDMLEKFPKYDDTRKYHVIDKNGETYNETLKKIDISWVSGNVYISTTNTYKGVTIFEKAPEDYKEDYLCHVYRDKDFLNLKYCHSNISLTKNLKKDLFIYIPENVSIDELVIGNVSSNIEISSINCEEIEIENVSGNVKLNKVNAKDISYEGASASLVASLTSYTKEISIEQISGDTFLTLPSINDGFWLTYDSISGELLSDFETIVKGNKYTYGSSISTNLEIDFYSVSGDLSLLKYDSSKEK